MIAASCDELSGTSTPISQSLFGDQRMILTLFLSKHLTRNDKPPVFCHVTSTRCRDEWLKLDAVAEAVHLNSMKHTSHVKKEALISRRESRIRCAYALIFLQQQESGDHPNNFPALFRETTFNYSPINRLIAYAGLKHASKRHISTPAQVIQQQKMRKRSLLSEKGFFI